MMFMEATLNMLCQAVQSTLMTWGGVFIGMLVITVLYIITIAGYFKCKKERAYHKAKIEIIFIGVVVVLSFVAKFGTFMCVKGYGNFGDGMNLFWQSLYAAIGGLTFEGLSEIDLATIIWQCLYYGSSIYAGLITLTIATLGLSYELYSYVRLLRREKNKDIYVFTSLKEETLQLAKSIKQHDIETSEKENRAKGKNRKGDSKSVIVFSGYDLKAFDKHDDLCRQVVMEGFLYWSFYKRNGKIKNIKKKRLTDNKAGNCEDRENYTQFDSLAKILHLNNKNIRRENNEKFQERRFCILAFESNKHIPEEENNIGLVVDDIKSRISCIEKDNLRIEYYILTKRDINYQAYIQRQKELVIEFADILGEKSGIENRCALKLSKKNRMKLSHLRDNKEDLLNNVCQFFIDNLVPRTGIKEDEIKLNEYEVKKLIWKYYCDKYIKDWNNILGEIKISDDDVKRLGFDQLSAENLKSIFVKIEKNEELRSNRIQYFKKLKAEYCKHFVVTAINEALIISKDVISDVELPFESLDNKYPNGDEKLIAYILGFGSTGQAIARALHMRSAYINKCGKAPETHFEVFDGKADEIGGLFDKEHIMWICNSDENAKEKKFRNIYKDDYEKNKKLLEKEIILPTVKFHKNSCFDLSIINELDKVTGKGEPSDREERPSVIAIALGSDYDNIRMANVLIADIIREENGNGNDVPQTIVVNIWDSNNNMLVDTCGGVWSNNHKTLKYAKNNLTVRIVGNNTDIYSYDKMLAHDKDADYNAGYDSLYNYIDNENNKKSIKNLGGIFKQPTANNVYKDASGTINDIIEKCKSEVGPNALEDYENIDMWKRESNVWVRCVGKMFDNLVRYKLTENLNEILLNNEKFNNAQKEQKVFIATVEAYKYLSKVEHQRWLRCYIANGWQYAEEKLEMRKYHNCIVPFEKLGADSETPKGKTALLNIINVIKMLGKDGIKIMNENVEKLVNERIEEQKIDKAEGTKEKPDDGDIVVSKDEIGKNIKNDEEIDEQEVAADVADSNSNSGEDGSSQKKE